MPRIKHIALTTGNPEKVAAFYKEAFDMKEVRRSPNGAVFLTDGYINLAILNYKTEKDADVGAHGPNFSGIHHFGFEVENLDEACEKLQSAQGQSLTQKDGLDTMMAPGSHRNFEMKWAGPTVWCWTSPIPVGTERPPSRRALRQPTPETPLPSRGRGIVMTGAG